MNTVRHLLLTALAASGLGSVARAEPPYECQLPDETKKLPFAADVPILFVSRGQAPGEWDKLAGFWNVGTEESVNPVTGKKETRRAVRVRLPLGLNSAPVVPAENPMTVAKWSLGKRLYFDPILSTNGEVACASCHAPEKGFTDRAPVSTGINGNKGGINAPTVINSAFNRFQFWDGRAGSLEAQAQGPVQNPKEMFSGTGDPWEAAIGRLNKQPEVVRQFEQVFGHGPTRDAAAKAIATYERTVLVGNSIHDRAEVLMRKRVADEETGKFELTAADYAAAIKAAAAKNDANALKALGSDGSDADAMGKRLLSGRTLFFNKARCATCHTGDTFTDHLFHNLGAGVVNGQLPAGDVGRYGALPLGHKDPAQVGAQKTTGLRGLLDTAPYLHTGNEKTLEDVVEFYDNGGVANPYLSLKMRDEPAEAAARAAGKPAVIPLKLNLTPGEKADLVLFLRALQGDPVDPIVADPKAFPK